MTSPLSFDLLLSALKAVGEETRLRILAILADGELNVSDLTAILGQSQPRVSRHLKLLVDAGLVERIREGSWAFFKLAEGSAKSEFLAGLIAALDGTDRVLAADRTRLVDVRRARAAEAAAYFRTHAADWDRLRALHGPNDRSEAAVRDLVGTRTVNAFLDIGTGTGRMLELLSPLATRSVGIDASAEMLTVARSNIEASGLRNVIVRQGDLFALPFERNSFDLITMHQVLHFLADGARAIREAARVLRPGGRLIIVDYAPHDVESLREEAAHVRLGFSRENIEGYLAAAGLQPTAFRGVPATTGPLSVSIWLARDPRIVSDALPALSEVA